MLNWISVHQERLYIMDKKEKKEKKFDTVKFFREVKATISKETKGMTFDELKEYINRRKLKMVR